MKVRYSRLGGVQLHKIKTKSPSMLSFLQGLVLEGGHGKLLIDEYLFPKAYATNVNEQWLQVLDLEERSREASHDYSKNMPNCTGTHSLVYSNISQQ